MSKKSRVRGCFDKQDGKRAQALLNSVLQPFYQIHHSLATKFWSKQSLLFTCQILGLLVNALATDEKYPLLNRDNLTIPNQMQLSQKQKSFSECFAAIWKSRLNLSILKQKRTLIDFAFSKLRTPKSKSDKCLKSPVSDESWTSNMVNGPKHSWNLHRRTFIIFIRDLQRNCVRESLSYCNAKSRDCLLTHTLSSKSILFL